MSRSLRIALTAVLTVALVEAPLQASAARMLGVVVQGRNAHLNSAEAAGGTTVFAGDVLATQAEGLLRLRIGTGQVYLLENSTVRLVAETGKLVAAVERGTLGFSFTGQQPITVQFQDTVVRPAAADATHGRLTAVSANEVVVSSMRGTLEVVSGTERFLVSEGTAYRILIEQEPEGEGKQDARRRKILAIIIGGLAVGALTGLIVYHALRSPNAP